MSRRFFLKKARVSSRLFHCLTSAPMEHCFLYDEETYKQSTEDIKAFLMKYAK